MKILFISSGNRYKGINPSIKSQAQSLTDKGCIIEHFTITERGIKGYVKSIFRLRTVIREGRFDLFHAHYSLSGIVAGIAGAKPLVVSLMGSDVYSSGTVRELIRYFVVRRWDRTIVKSEKMKAALALEVLDVIPNGVNMNVFKRYDKHEAMIKYKFNPQNKHIVFFGSEKRKEKNLDLARDAVNDMAEKDIDFHIINNVPFVDIPGLLSAADVLLLTSFWEGSPNIIKEAMACDLPLVATDVGDIREVIGNCEGCYICSFDKDDISVKLKEALDFNKRTDGRNHIRNIESSYIAGKIIEIYKTLIK